MNKAKVLAVLALLICNVFYGQNLTLKWSEKQPYDGVKNGFFKNFEGENDKYIYARFYRGMKGRKATKKVRLVALDKNSMKEVGSVKVTGFKENKLTKKNYKDLEFEDLYIADKGVFVFWIKRLKGKKGKRKKELYVEVFSPKLKRLKKLKKIYEHNFNKKLDNPGSLFTVFNKLNAKVVIGEEKGGNVGESVVFNFKVLDMDLKFSNAGQVELPLKYKKRKGLLFSTSRSRDEGLSSSYLFGDDGHMHLKSSIYHSRKERKESAKAQGKKNHYGELSFTTLYSIVDLSKSTIKSIPFRFEGKSILNFVRKTDEKGMKIFGFYREKGSSNQGLFHCRLNSNYKFENIKFTPFTKSQLDELFRNDLEDRIGDKRGCCFGTFGKKKGDDGKGDKQKLADNYRIEDYLTKDEDGSVILFCSRIRNWSVTTCTTDANGNRSCTTKYYSQRSNLTTFKMKENGTIEWSKNVDRSILYSGGISVWHYDDVSVVKSGKGYYAIYGNSSEKRKSNKKKKAGKMERRKRLKDPKNEYPFQYAYFDDETGKVTEKVYKVNKPGLKKKQRRRVSPIAISVFNNKFYCVDSKVYPKWEACLCPPVFALTPWIGNHIFEGYGNFGVIKPVD